MERPMSIMLTYEDTPDDPASLRSAQEQVPSPQQEPPDQGAADQPSRLPSFDESCPHVRDQIIPMNGGRFNVDHYLRVLRAKAELDVSIAMALTAAGQHRPPVQAPVRHFTLIG